MRARGSDPSISPDRDTDSDSHLDTDTIAAKPILPQHPHPHPHPHSHPSQPHHKTRSSSSTSQMFSNNASCLIVGLLGGWIYGYNTGIIGGLSDPLIKHTFFKDHSNQPTFNGILTACILVGGCLGSFLGGYLDDRIGRKRSLTLCALICVICTILMSVFQSYATVVVFRTFLGLSVGFSVVLCPAYVTEMSPLHIRGRMGTVFQIAICASILMAQITNYAFNPSDESDAPIADWKWKVQFAMGAIPGLLLLCFVPFIPESTAWIHKKDDTHSRLGTVAADDSCAPLSPSGDVSDARDETIHIPQSPYPTGKTGWSLLLSRHGLGWLSTAIILAGAQQLTGINAIVFYAPKIFKDADLSNPLVLTFSVIGVWNLVSVFISFALVDRLGRRPLMLSSLAIMGLGTGLLGLAYAAFPQSKATVAIISIMMFVGAFECGPGPLFWIMASEAFPPVVRQQGLSFTNGVCWICNIIVSFGFPVLDSAAGSAATFFFFAGTCFFSLVAIWYKLPETKQTHEKPHQNATYDQLQNDQTAG